MFKRILVPLDGSERSERAIPLAARIARTAGGSIVLVSVVIPPVEFGTYSVERLVALKPGAFEVRLSQATDYLKGIIATYASVLADIDVEIEPTSGATAPEIFSTACLEGVDLIILCSHGETGLKRLVFSSIAHQAVHHSPVPVLVLGEHGALLPVQEGTPLRVLVPLDGSTRAEAALVPAAELLAAWTMHGPEVRGEMHLLCVVDLPSAYERMKSQAHISDGMQEEAKHEAEAYVKAVPDRLRLGPLAGTSFNITTSVVVSSDVAGTIIKVAEDAEGPEQGYDMIAMATHGRSGLKRLLMGSVTEHILGHTKLPLLVMRPQEHEAAVEKTAETSEEEALEMEKLSLTALF